MKNRERIDIIMLSTFDKNAGGRETWLYNFLPKLVEYNKLKIRLFGFKRPAQENLHEDLQDEIHKVENGQSICEIHMLSSRTGKLPLAYYMYNELRSFYKRDNSYPHKVMAMGILEMFMVVRVKAYKTSEKIVWLRSIFSHEKAYRIPRTINKWFLKYELQLLKKANLLIANGDDIRDFYAAYGLDIHVIKNGIDIEKWNAALPTLKDPLHIAYVGRLSQVKGIESFLELIEKVNSGVKAKNYVFHVVGQAGTYADEVERLVAENKLIDHGVVSNDTLPELISEFHVCVALTFASETGGGGGTSNAMLEQMASRRIMLAWDNAIFRQYLSKDNAYLAEQFDTSMLEQKLYKIRSNPSEAIKRAENARNTIKPYTYKANVGAFVSLIESTKT